MARTWQELFITGEDAPEPAAREARAAHGLLPPPAREPVEDARGAGRGAAGDGVPEPRRRDLGAPRGDADLCRRRRHHHGQDRRAAGDRGQLRGAERRRAAHQAADRAPRRGGPSGGGHDRPARRPHRDPDGGSERDRQDHDDREDRLAPPARARQVGAARRGRHLPGRRRGAARGVGGARRLRHRAGRPGLRSGRGGVRRHRGRPSSRPRRGDLRHGRPPAHPAAPDGGAGARCAA